MLLTKILLVALATFLLNLPFGYWRGGVRKFSFAWIVAIHAPVPLVVGMRLLSHIGFIWWTYPIMVAAYFSGQFLGARLRRRRLAARAAGAPETA